MADGPQFDKISISDADLDQLQGAMGILTPTDDGREPAFTYERRAAAQLAARLQTTLFLVDRSLETWGETAHVRGPATVEELRTQPKAEHMVAQMEEAEALGAPDVRAVAPSMPTFDSLRDAIEVTGATVIVTPPKLDHPKLRDRWQIHGDLPARIKENAGGRQVVVAHPDGRLELF